MTKSEFLLGIYRAQRKHGMQPNMTVAAMFLLAERQHLTTPEISRFLFPDLSDRQRALRTTGIGLRDMEDRGWVRGTHEKSRPIPRTWSLTDKGTAMVLDALAPPVIPFLKPQAIAS